jgi:tetratricopeptide (TPR) repeat protein
VTKSKNPATKSSDDGLSPARSSRAAPRSLPAWAAIAVLALAIGAVYRRALDVPLFFDDDAAIVSNDSIHSLWPLFGSAEHPGPLRTPAPRPTAGRPLVNLTFALNYYFGGVAPAGYHVTNVLIHFSSSLLLWALIKRTLLLPYFANRFDPSAGWLALDVALLWALHPLQTESVIYATQRTELMMALFYLATLYCSLRYWSAFPLPRREGQGEGSPVHRNRGEGARNPPRARRAAWLTLAVFACLAGMASKEVMVSAPLMVLLFDRTFVSGSMSNALRRSWPLYTGLAATWVLFLLLNINAPRGDTAGAGVRLAPAMTSWWLTQAQVFWMYLKLVVWPTPLLIHYVLPYLKTLNESWMYVVPLLLLAVVSLILLWWNDPAGYLLTCVFTILAPTCLVPIITETAAERRMYLPLAALTALFVVAAFLLTQWLSQRMIEHWRLPRLLLPRIVFTLPILFLAIVLGLISASRLDAYYDVEQLWQDVVRRQPSNHMAHYNLGGMLEKSGRLPEAIAEFQSAARLRPDAPITFNALGHALTDSHRLPEAIEALHTAVKLQPDFIDALNNLGFALTKSERPAEAIPYLQRAIQLNPNSASALNNLGFALILSGRHADADRYLHRAIELKPDFAEAHNNLGIVLGMLGNMKQAIDEFQQAIRYNKNYAKAHNNLGRALVETGDSSRALEEFRLGVQLDPQDATGQYNFAVLLSRQGRSAEALAHYKEALQLKPHFIPIYNGLAETLNLVNQPNEAIATAKKGIEVARSSGQQAEAAKLEDWLKHYQDDLQRGSVASPPQPAPVRESTQKP